MMVLDVRGQQSFKSRHPALSQQTTVVARFIVSDESLNISNWLQIDILLPGTDWRVADSRLDWRSTGWQTVGVQMYMYRGQRPPSDRQRVRETNLIAGREDLHDPVCLKSNANHASHKVNDQQLQKSCFQQRGQGFMRKEMNNVIKTHPAFMG